MSPRRSPRRSPLATVVAAGVAALLVPALWLAACSSDGSGGGGDGGTPIDGGQDADLSVDFGAPDTGDDGGDAGDGGYRSDTAGLGCTAPGDCEAGELCVGADPATGTEGYCTILDCVDHAECDFGVDESVFCCSEFGEFRGCFREAPDAVCGGGTGQQGDDCSTGGQSDCEGQSFYCVDVYGAQFCAGECDPGAPDACDEGSWCYPTSGTTGLCLPSGDTPEGEPCADDPASCRDGAVCDGAFGDEPSPTSFCARLCTRNRDCLATEWCRVYPGQGAGTCIPVGDAPAGASCAEDRWACEQGLYCLNEGTRIAQCAHLCQRETECDEGWYCNFFSDALGVCQVEGDRETGEPCGDDPYACVPGAVCIGFELVGYNPDAYCSESCRLNPTTCGDGFYCQDFGAQGSFCLPDGDAEAGEPCDGPTDCAADAVCLYAGLGAGGEEGQGRCQATCAPNRACGSGEWCAGQDAEGNGVCLPRGDATAGEECAEDPFSCQEGTFCGGDPPLCLQSCDVDDAESCPAGLYCGETTGNYCYPSGETAVGGACTEPFECVEGSFCAFLDDSGGPGDGAGVCTEGCGGDVDCDDAFWCLRTAAFGLCVPRGTVEAGGDCSADRFACAEDHVCAFRETDDAYCARDCTGFADRCGDGEVCRWVGSGLSLCMQVGDSGAGSACASDPSVCDAASLCVNAGEADAFCAALCTFAAEACPEGTACTYFPNGLGLCVPPDFEGGGPL